MGKKARKTRWRTLTITDEHSDSEDSNSTTAQRLPKSYQQKSYYNKFSYSSQSTPRRRYQNDGTKSTRSSSTASENKITFNEDEYTRITTPRQDVLFKKGYLNKPRNYQTQTSTGTSTTSTSNSTGNGTPDYQSTDLEYESQFVFPNGFVDQNGIYYINGYESYPLMLYNPPTYYPEFSNRKSKRYSTDSLTESMSPNNEEATSQDLSGGEASNNVSDYNGQHQMYNMVYPGYYINGVCPTHEMINGHCPADQTRRIKKRRRRKTSKSQATQDSSECTEDESDCCDEEETKDNEIPLETPTNCHNETEETTTVVTEEKADSTDIRENRLEIDKTKSNIENGADDKTEDSKADTLNEKIECTSPDFQEEKQNQELDCLKEKCSPEVHQLTSEMSEENSVNEDKLQSCSSEQTASKKSDLKPDAEEFIPRAYRNSEIAMSSNLQFVKVPPNFVPIPILPLGEFNGQNFSPAFIPPGIPINFLPPDPKMYPNFVSFVPNNFICKREPENEGSKPINTEHVDNQMEQVEFCDNSNTTKNEKNHHNKEATDKNIQNVNNKTIDIATVVSKLEVAAKEQENQDVKKINKLEEVQGSPRRRYFENKSPKSGPKYKNYRRNNYYSPQNSPQKKNNYVNGDGAPLVKEKSSNMDTFSNRDPIPEQKPEIKDETSKCAELLKGVVSTDSHVIVQESPKHAKNSPEKNRKLWKQHYPNGSPKWYQNNDVKDFRNKQSSKFYNESDVRSFRTKTSYKNYSEMLKNKTEQKICEDGNNEKQNTNFETFKTGAKVETTAILSPKQPNQWIAVSNRKRRKNKNVEESDEKEEKEEHSHTETIESYDVNLLLDMSPTEDEVLKVETVGDINLTSMTNSIVENQESSVKEDDTLNVNTVSISDIEQQLIIKIDAVEPESISEFENVSKDDEAVVKEVTEFPEFNIIPTQTQTENQSKKKSKKGTQKPLTKRVIITDVDLSMNCKETKTPIKKIIKKLKDTKTVTEKPDPEPEHENKTEEHVACGPANRNEEEEKKKSKKKKKSSKMTSNNSLSSSNTTINVVDEAYDFLLDSALSDDSVDRTNVEVSQELDKLIQKGMYSNMEDKIKSLNIDENDGFFKSIFSMISSRESSVEKTGLTKSPDLSKVLPNTRNLCTPCSVSQENISQNRDINKILPDLDSPNEDGIFLENPDVSEVLQDQTATKDMDNEETKIEDSIQNSSAISEETKLENEVESKSYPITEAVKEWMNKTREKTPDVVLLKSPSDIYREFCDSASESDSQMTHSKNLSSNTVNGDHGEITIFRNGLYSREGSVEEYWENDLETCKTTNKHSGSDANKCINESNRSSECVEEGEDIMEIYESKYGKNEDYLKLQKEEKIQEKTNNSNYLKSRYSPFQAICCSIM